MSYDVLIVCPGIQLDWDRIPGVSETLGVDGVSSNYEYHLAPKTWEFTQATTSGTAVFTMPSGPIKCAGAPQKAAYLACDRWRKAGVLDAIDVHMVLPTPGMFGVPVFAQALEKVVADYGITVHFQSELASVDVANKRATFTSLAGETRLRHRLRHDARRAPPVGARLGGRPARCRRNQPTGYVDVDKHTLQHVRYPNVLRPRRRRLDAQLQDRRRRPQAGPGPWWTTSWPSWAARASTPSYGGYASCPLVTSDHEMLLAEFDYTMQHTPSFPIIGPDQAPPRPVVPEEVRPAVPVLETPCSRAAPEVETNRWGQVLLLPLLGSAGPPGRSSGEVEK